MREQFAPRVRADDKHRVVDVRVVHHLERVIPLASFRRRRRRQLASSPHLAALLSSRPSHDAFDFSKRKKRETPARRVEAAAFPPLLASDRRVFLIYAWEKEGGSFSVDKEDAGSTILESSLGETRRGLLLLVGQ